MKKHTKSREKGHSQVQDKIAGKLTVGIDLGDKLSRVCVLDQEGEIIEESSVRTTDGALRQRFAAMPSTRVAIEAGAHSPWVSRLLEGCGHEVLVANARKMRLIYENDRKCDRVDAESLARLARLDPKLLGPIQHRDADTQADLAMIRARAAVVTARTQIDQLDAWDGQGDGRTITELLDKELPRESGRRDSRQFTTGACNLCSPRLVH